MTQHEDLYAEVKTMEVSDVLRWKETGYHKNRQASLFWFFKAHCKGKVFKTFVHKEVLFIVRVE